MTKVKSWAKDNQLTEQETDLADTIVSDIPGEFDEFYLKLEGLGNKHYISKDNEKLLVRWIKLTAELLNS